MPRRTNDTDDAKIKTWARLLRVSRKLLEHVEAALKRDGFPPLAWYDVLLELRRAGKNGLRPFELQDRILLAQYNLSRLTDRLVDAGYAERRPCADDGRGHMLALTADGKDLLKRMWPSYKAAIESEFGKKLSPPEIQGLMAVLDKLDRD
jgi:DNA-binding MarR family transcriptional regulator